MIQTRSVQFVILVAAFAIFSAVVASGVTASVDDSASRFFKSLQGNDSADTLMVVLTSLGDMTTLFVFGIVITIIRRTRKFGLIFLIAIVVLAVLVMYLKPVFGRNIPPYGFSPSAPYLQKYQIEQDSLSPGTQFLSYPSGHAARAAALSSIMGYALYRKFRPAGYAIWAFPVLIGITRLYVMQHYPADIIGGALLGVIVSIVLGNAMKLEQPFSMARFKSSSDSKAAGETLPG